MKFIKLVEDPFQKGIFWRIEQLLLSLLASIMYEKIKPFQNIMIAVIILVRESKNLSVLKDHHNRNNRWLNQENIQANNIKSGISP